MVVMFSVAVLPTGFMESQSYFNCGPRQAQFHPIVIAVFPLNDAKNVRMNQKKTYACSFVEVKVRQSIKKSWTR